MAHLDEIRGLAEYHATRISSSPRDWMNYLDTAARLYRYPFMDQLLIHAQRPKATACASLELWNEKMLRWVNRGAKGIALLDETMQKTRFRYVFDIQDTHKVKGGRTPYLWQLQEKQQDALLNHLEEVYGLEAKDAGNLSDALMATAKYMVEENLDEYLDGLELCERHQQERELSMLQLRDMKHNMKNNLVSILAYAEKGEDEKIIEFIQDIMDESGLSISVVANSGNIVIDSLLGYWYVTAQKKGIDFSLDIKIPMKMEFKGADICLILGNLLENAVEAAERVKKKKYIKIQMKYDKGNLLIFLMNSYQGQLIKMKDERLKSTKSDAGNHGVGLPSVYRAAAKYNGIVTVDDSIPERFLVRVVLYGEKE